MASLELIANEVRALSKHYPHKAMKVDDEVRWVQDYVDSLRDFTDRQVTEACRRWRLGEERKMAGVGQLMALAKASLPSLMVQPPRDRNEEWTPKSIGPGEFADMTLRQKAREHRLQASAEELAACKLRQRSKPESEQSDSYYFHRRQATGHHAEAARLVGLAKGVEPAFP